MLKRKALVVGVDHYTHLSGLYGCVNDAQAVKNILERNSDGSVNFGVLPLSGTHNVAVSRADLREQVRQLFADDHEIALFYFAGHGHIETAGGYLCTTDTLTGDDGLPLSDVLTFANHSKAQNKVIILDSCHSGIASANPHAKLVSELSEGVTILTAATADHYA